MTDQRMTAAELAAQPPAFWQRVAAGEVTVTDESTNRVNEYVGAGFIKAHRFFTNTMNGEDEYPADAMFTVTTPDTDADLARLTAELAAARQALDEAAAVIAPFAKAGEHLHRYGYRADALLPYPDDTRIVIWLGSHTTDAGREMRLIHLRNAAKWAKAHENAARGPAQAPGVENGVAGQETRGKGD